MAPFTWLAPESLECILFQSAQERSATIGSGDLEDI